MPQLVITIISQYGNLLTERFRHLPDERRSRWETRCRSAKHEPSLQIEEALESDIAFALLLFITKKTQQTIVKSY